MTQTNDAIPAKEIAAAVTHLLKQMQATADAKQQLQYQLIQSLKQFETDLDNFTAK